MAGNLSEQVKLQNQINKIIKDRNSLLQQQNALMTKQAKLAQAVQEAAKGKGLGELNKALKGTNEQSRQMQQQLPQATQNMKDMGAAASESSENLDRFNKQALKMGAVLGALKGLKKGIGALRSITNGTFKVLGTFVKTIFNIGKAIISIPFKIFGALVNMSQQMGSPAFLQALEEVRASFGAIGRTKVRDQVYELRSQIGGLGIESNQLGVTFARIFGSGSEGLAKAAKENLELANHLGGSFLGLSKRIKDAGKLVTYFRKGMGFTTEQQATLIKLTEKSGGVFEKRMENLARLTQGAVVGFDISAKEVGKTVGLMFDDVKTFGGFTDKQMVQMAVQTRRLGVELKTLQKIADGFDDYEKAQKNVSFLNRAFGMTVDTMKLFREQDPVKRIQMLQESFKRTGRDISTMQRGELQYFAQAANVSEKEAKILFSKKNLEMDYNDVKKATSKAEKKSVSTAQVLLKLSKQIERVFGSGGKKYKGFFDALVQGFGRGIYYTSEFRLVMRNLRRSLRLTNITGRSMGRNFVKFFPGVKQFLGALADFFDPKKFVPTLRAMNRHMKEFYLNLGRGKTVSESLDILLMRMKRTFVDFYGGRGGAIEQMKRAFDIIATLAINLKLEIMSRVVDAATSGLDAFGDVLYAMMVNPQATIGAAATAGGGAFADRFGNAANKLFGKIKFKLIPAVERNAPVIFEAILKLLELARGFILQNADKIGEAMLQMYMLSFKLKLQTMKAVFGGGMETAMVGGAVMFGPAITGGLSMLMSGMMLRSIASGAVNAARKGKKMPGPIKAFKKMGKSVVKTMGRSLMGAITFGGRVTGPVGAAITAGVLAVGNGFYRAFTAGKGQNALVEGGKGVVSGLVSGITFGMISHEDLWGKYFEDPLQQSVYDLERSGGHYGKVVAENIKKTRKHVAELKAHNKAFAEFAKNQAKQGKLMFDPTDEKDVSLDAFYKSHVDKHQAAAEKAEAELNKMTENIRSKGATALFTEFGGDRGVTRNTGSFFGNDMNAEALAEFKKVFDPSDPKSVFHGLDEEQQRAVTLIRATGKMSDKIHSGYYKNIIARTSFINDAIQLHRKNSADQASKQTEMVAAMTGTGKGSMMQKYIDFAMSSDGGLQTEAQAVRRYYSYMRKHYQGMVNEGVMTQEEMKAKMKPILDRFTSSEAQISATFVTNNTEALYKHMIEKHIKRNAKGENIGFKGGIDPAKVKEQAEVILTEAFKTGDLSKIPAGVLREKLVQDFKKMGEGTRIDAAQEKKLSALENAKATVERIKALSTIPDELKKLNEKLRGVNEATIAKNVDKLFKTAKIIADEVEKGANTHLKKLIESKVDTGMIAELTTRLNLISQIGDAVKRSVGSPIPGEARINDRIGLISHTITKMAEKFGKKESKDAFKTLKELDFSGPQLALNSTSAIATQTREITGKPLPASRVVTTYVNRLYDAVDGFAGVFTDIKEFVKFAPPKTYTDAILVMQQAKGLALAVPSFSRGYSKKVASAKSVLATVADMMDHISDSVNRANLTGTVDLVKAMSSGGELNVKMDTNTNLNATIVVKINSAQLARAIVATPFTHSGTTNDYVSTKKFPSGVGNARSGLPKGTHGE